MESVAYILDSSSCTVILYQQDPDKYRGNIACSCKEKAWFVKGFSTEKFNRAPCFAAHHTDNCDFKIELIPDESGEVAVADHTAIHIDLDKQRKQSIEVLVPEQNPAKVSQWGTTRRHSSIGDYPENKSLRQILTSLSRNPNYPQDEAAVKMVADGGRIVLQGELADLLIPQKDIMAAPLGEAKIFWGRINNVNKSQGVLWLNCGNYNSEPSILIDDDDLEADLLLDFKLKDTDDLQGADFIVVGVPFRAKNGKPYLKFGFTKYIAFRKYKLQDGVAE
ncbi:MULTISPECIES: hypothetical protein [unclassified Pseudomonas]|uniref:hypothetical protein n=1 Tax=unclassified Pseudomonas TaxID=196821 RepID=UPI002B224CC5|nr:MULTISPECIES: hypothetical protein [unclassified Pseudomonas]MEA9977056.1 hypothetical protein [Pseudomonas sp. RTS4]MEB0198696.1 hypothetical protein [Pseudomonas sp. 5S4]MEB0246784.1 hypothetical protein [Pseudomonas sp. 10S5]